MNIGKVDTTNYRNMTNEELAVFAEQRKVELARMGIPLGTLWEEVLHRLLNGRSAQDGQGQGPVPIVHPCQVCTEEEYHVRN